MTILKVKNLSVTFPSPAGRVYAVRDVSFGLSKGETLGLIGESGSGKSVIGLSLLRLLPRGTCVTGSAMLDGTDLLSASVREMDAIRGKRISLLPQNPALALNPLLKNGLQISEVYQLLGLPRWEWKSRSVDMLNRLLLSDPARVIRQYPHQLSGGMRQRLMAAIALSFYPELLIADEPTKGLDPDSRQSTIKLFQHIRRDHGQSMILITHDLDLAGEICDRVAVMYSGEFVEIGSPKKVLDSPSHPYTRGLMAALPRNGLVPLDGHAPGGTMQSAGCLFSGRCKYQRTGCSSQQPEFVSHAGGQVRCLLYC